VMTQPSGSRTEAAFSSSFFSTLMASWESMLSRELATFS